MTWVRLDDSFFMNAKTATASNPAKLLYLAGLCHCAAQLTDGFIAASVLAPLCAQVHGRRQHAAELVRVGLWTQVPDGYQIPDYLDYNPAREQVTARRERDRERVNRFRSKSPGNAVSNGVGNGVTPPVGNGVSNGAHVTSRNETSSSSSENELQPRLSRPEEEDEIHKEALRRVALRPNIASRERWVAKCEENLRAEHWKPEPKRVLHPLPELPPPTDRQVGMDMTRALKNSLRPMEDAG